ncbi:helix-turn-helix domain-containing protein [Actinobacillus equuli]|uniref:helix-turn-helix domain-containing protein n=1 Tax=Actinobacillus equuli TaxID=718 RepID=UPI002442CBAE|nr:helix-turn-helix domain-containing protein [Actinobacillus equuli]WGE74518.1 helix-turn-helix domain-containing protein [Actinobacillus equuli subsp. haemolyticus]
MLINDPNSLAVYLRDIRKQQKQSQKMIAQRVGLRQATISTFETRPDKVTIETLFKIVHSLGLEIHLEEKHTNMFNRSDEW